MQVIARQCRIFVCQTCFCAILEPCNSLACQMEGWAGNQPAYHHAPVPNLLRQFVPMCLGGSWCARVCMYSHTYSDTRCIPASETGKDIGCAAGVSTTVSYCYADRGPGFPLLQHVCWPQILQGKPLARSLEQVQPGLVAPPKGRAHAYPDDDDDHSAWQPALSPSFRVLFATKILCCAYYFACPVARGRPSQRSLPLTGGLCCRTSRLVRTAESVREKPSQGSLAATCIQYKVPFRSRWTPALH